MEMYCLLTSTFFPLSSLRAYAGEYLKPAEIQEILVVRHILQFPEPEPQLFYVNPRMQSLYLAFNGVPLSKVCCMCRQNTVTQSCHMYT